MAKKKSQPVKTLGYQTLKKCRTLMVNGKLEQAKGQLDLLTIVIPAWSREKEDLLALPNIRQAARIAKKNADTALLIIEGILQGWPKSSA